ncbi:alpha/beta hydrolase [Pseudomonas lalucatii]|uniref:Alpha/beta hydrolase n=1 Tax=Pseudomonas lalucatii TaxID=1424203 RepID=A0ABS5PX47_9PSED|nr:alpha/beta hydrolase [Pseudomonas lalucatii]MBS7661061.1 alpha/beta hydrolase [Pseudomonas lalucatii]
MAIDAASTAFLGQLAEQNTKPFHKMEPDEARQFMAGLREVIGSGPDMHRIEETILGQGAQRFRVRVLIPDASPRGVIVYYHGGGWVLMSIDDHDTLGRCIAAETGCSVVLVDYRLAPEHRYPAAVEDAWLALNWAAAQRQALTGAADAPLIVAGDSAGGNLAAVVAQRAARSGEPQLAQQVLIYPVTQPDLHAPGYLDPGNQGLLSQKDMQWFWDHYLPDRSRRQETDASPLLTGDLRRLPPTVLITAEHDVLRDEGEAYALKLSEAGVAVSWKRFAGQIHGFFTLLNILPASLSGRAFVVEQIIRQLQANDSTSAPLMAQPPSASAEHGAQSSRAADRSN